MERKDSVAFKGKPMTLVGKELKKGDVAPDFEATDMNLNPVKFSAFRGKTCIISSVVSVDTPVCDKQTHYFNEAVARMGKDAVIITISMDLPFALKRWCGSSQLSDQIYLLTDYKKAEFGEKYGVLLKEWHLLSRAVFVVDKNGIIQGAYYNQEISNHPNYELIIKDVEKLQGAGVK